MTYQQAVFMALTIGACGGLPSPIPPNFKPGDGYGGCKDISAAARVRASQTSGWGWAFSVGGAGTAIAGTTLIPLDGTLTNHEKIVAGSLTAGGALLVAIGQAWFKRSDAASTLASETASILGERDSDRPIAEEMMVSKCNTALGAWEKSRADATALAATLLQQQKNDTKAAKLKLQIAPAAAPPP